MLLFLGCHETQCRILLRKQGKLRTPQQTRFKTVDLLLHPSAPCRYDQIVVMKNGRVCEQGACKERTEAKNQFYARSLLANG